MAKAAPVFTLAPKTICAPAPVEGVRFATGQAQIRYQGRTDVMLALFDPATQVAGVFTRSKCPSAPVDFCRKNLAQGQAAALLVNSGNANAFTGKIGEQTVDHCATSLAKAAKIPASQIFLASTGVIGEPLAAEKFDAVLPDLIQRARADEMPAAARAIMTTDTFPKLATAQADIGGVTVTISGMAKGAGMIAPDMATMLSFIFTDAPIAAPVLQALLSRQVKNSFNAITVDSDTSTSDTLLLFATGAAAKRGAPAIKVLADRRLASFRRTLSRVLLNLAQQVVRDGEGARKFIEITVSSASSAQAAKRIAFAIANSPLVKTAVAGEDANWGRIVMAVGKAGEKAERDKLSIAFGGIRVAHQGQRDPDYDEEKVSLYMKGDKIDIDVDLGLGSGKAKVWTCDLTKEYIAINGDYRS